MAKLVLTLMVLGCCVLVATAAMSATVSMKLSGAGKVNDSTIKAGEKVSLDVYFDNEKPRMGLSIGFKISSPDKSITTIVHPADSGKGLDDSAGDVKGYNGYEGKGIFDLLNKPIFSDWDGTLPDQMGFMTHIFKKIWPVQPVQSTYTRTTVVFKLVSSSELSGQLA